jgi:hypothetical protein
VRSAGEHRGQKEDEHPVEGMESPDPLVGITAVRKCGLRARTPRSQSNVTAARPIRPKESQGDKAQSSSQIAMRIKAACVGDLCYVVAENSDTREEDLHEHGEDE